MRTTEESHPTRLLSDTRGAVYVEFLIAFVPVFIFFLCLIQLGLLFSAKLVVEHAAQVGSRAAAVIIGDESGPYQEGSPLPHVLSAERRSAVRGAVLVSLGSMILDNSIQAVRVLHPATAGGEDLALNAAVPFRNGKEMIRVRVEATVLCKLPIANAIACPGNFLSPIHKRSMIAEAAFPYQGANYDYE